MTTAIKTLFASALAAIILTSSPFNTSAQEVVKNTRETVRPTFSMIQVKGNVKLHLTQGSKDSIYVETDHNSEDVVVKQIGAKLLISSNRFVPADVYVTVRDLKRIEAYGSAEVRTIGRLNFKVLQVFLSDSASARIKVNTEDLYTVVKDNSVLRLSGTSTQYTYLKGKESKLKTTKFAALKTVISEPVFAVLDLDELFLGTLHFHNVAFSRIK